jgi:hypothetical protein
MPDYHPAVELAAVPYAIEGREIRVLHTCFPSEMLLTNRMLLVGYGENC